MGSYKSYILKTSSITLLFLIVVAGFNVFIDPFKFFNSPLIKNVNRLKPEFLTHIRMTKAHQIRLLKPEIIILGSSRVEFGLNPEHPGFSSSKQKAYNLGLQSINISETLSYLKHAQAIHPLKQVVLGLDFFMFNNNKINEADFDHTRLAPLKLGWYKDIFRALLTYDGLMASISTLKQQRDPTAIKYFANGFRNDDNNWIRIQQKGGHRQAAINNEQYTLYALDGFTFFNFSQVFDDNQSLKDFTEILNFCKKNNIDLRMFISPIHARKLQLLHQIGLWEAFENWKKELGKLTELNAPLFSIWDFTGFNQITTEPFPAKSDTNQQMNWYWESSHYKKETGDLILNKIFNINSKKTFSVPKEFGVKLSSSNLNGHLKKTRSEQSIFQIKHSKTVDEINQMLIKTLSQRKKTIKMHPTLLPRNLLMTISYQNKKTQVDYEVQ